MTHSGHDDRGGLDREDRPEAWPGAGGGEEEEPLPGGNEDSLQPDAGQLHTGEVLAGDREALKLQPDEDGGDRVQPKEQVEEERPGHDPRQVRHRLHSASPQSERRPGQRLHRRVRPPHTRRYGGGGLEMLERFYNIENI